MWKIGNSQSAKKKEFKLKSWHDNVDSVCFYYNMHASTVINTAAF